MSHIKIPNKSKKAVKDISVISGKDVHPTVWEKSAKLQSCDELPPPSGCSLAGYWASTVIENFPNLANQTPAKTPVAKHVDQNMTNGFLCRKMYLSRKQTSFKPTYLVGQFPFIPSERLSMWFPGTSIRIQSSKPGNDIPFYGLDQRFQCTTHRKKKQTPKPRSSL